MGCGAKIHLDEIGQQYQGPPLRRIAKVVERDQVAHLLEAAADGNGFLVHLDIFKELEDHPVSGKQRGIVAHQKIPRAVQERAAPLREALDPK